MASNWLPEDRVIRLTAYELGVLSSILLSARQRGEANFMVNKPGPKGEIVEITMIERLLEKALATAKSMGAK